MILDERNEFCDAVSVIKTAGASYLIGDVIDSGSVARDLGEGEEIYLVISVDTSIITAGSAGTISFSLCSDAQAAISVDGSQTTHFTSQAFVTDDAALNDLDAGDIAVCIALPREGAVYEQYLGIVVTVATTDTTAGKVNAFLTKDPAKYRAYPDATN